MSLNHVDAVLKDLDKLPWNTSPGKMIYSPPLQDVSSKTRMAWKFDAKELRSQFFGKDYWSWVVCGIRVRTSVESGPPGGEPCAHTYSVFLRKNNLSFLGMPGDFSMARENEWSPLAYPFPVLFLADMDPQIFIERELDPLEYRQIRPRPMPVVEILFHRVKDLSISNYVFVMKDTMGHPVVRNIYVQTITPKLVGKHYFQGGGGGGGGSSTSVPGPIKVIPSWGLIRAGWHDSMRFHRGERVEEIEFLAKNMWTSP